MDKNISSETTKNPNGSIPLIDPYWYRPEIKNKLHMIEPVWPEMKQLVGRAVRCSSHDMLTKDERFVETIIYKSNS